MNNDSLPFFANWSQILAFLVGVIALFVSIWVYVQSKQKRELTCSFGEIVTPIELKSGEAFRGDITILYQSQPVANLFVSRATLKNTGNQPIRATEVVEPITFAFPTDTQIIKEPQIVQTTPENFKAQWRLNQSRVTSQANSATVEFTLFNPGDSLTVDFVCTGQVKEPKVLARIEGISSIYIGREIQVTSLWLTKALLAMMFTFLGVFATFAAVDLMFDLPFLEEMRTFIANSLLLLVLAIVLINLRPFKSMFSSKN